MGNSIKTDKNQDHTNANSLVHGPNATITQVKDPPVFSTGLQLVKGFQTVESNSLSSDKDIISTSETQSAEWEDAFKAEVLKQL